MRYQDTPLPRSDDFALRRRIPTLLQFTLMVAANFILVLTAHLFTVSPLGFALIVLLSLIASSAVLIWSVQNSRDTMLNTEFQNALFGAAISIGHQFCLIARKDGTIVYTDRGFNAMYPQFDRTARHHIEDVLEVAGIAGEESGRICDAAYNGQSAQFHIGARDGNGIVHPLLLSVDPIRRPQNYIFLRARQAAA